nr:hypothetical protein [Haslea silbo]QUS63948.1 hypothetical protein [Haslea silbo]
MGKDCHVRKHHRTRIFLAFDAESGESVTGYQLTKRQSQNHDKDGIDGVGSKAPIYRTFSRESSMIADLNQDDSTQSELVPKGGQRTITSPSGKIIINIPRGGDNNQPGKPSKSSPGSRAKGAAKRDFARRQKGKKPTSGRSGGSPFAQAFTVEPKFPARPGRNQDGLLGRFSAQPTPDPYNPGCTGGPRSITVLSQSKSSEQDSVREVTTHDGVKDNQQDSYYEPSLNSTFEKNQLQKKFDHAKDFGVEGNFNPANRDLYQRKFIEHMKSTHACLGTYRGWAVYHYYDPRTNLNVMVDRNTNKFISGWRLSDEQIINMKNNGNIQ